MAGMPKHSAGGDRYAAAPRRDHLWVLVIIAACALLEVWASWLAIGSMSGFPRIGGARGLPTDWTLAVTTEAYWGYALYSWLAAAPGPRSRAFAMWSAVAVFILSLTGQGAAHLVKPGTEPPPVLVVFVTALPVLVLALIAILVHLRQADREVIEARERKAAEDERKASALRAEADERTRLRAELERVTAESADRQDAMQRQVDALAGDLATARAEAERATAKAEVLARKLKPATGVTGGGNRARKPAGSSARKPALLPAEATPVNPDDLPGNWDALDTEARVLALVDKGYSASKAGLVAGVTDARGRQIARLARDLSATAPQDVVGGTSAAD